MNFSSRITPFGFYYLDREYIEAMHVADKHVPYADYEDIGRAKNFIVDL